MKKISLSILLASSCAYAGPQISSPLTVDEAKSTEVMTALTLDRSGYEALKVFESVTLSDFALSAGLAVDLDLEQREVYAPGARLTVMTDEGEIEVDRPEVTLFGGYVAGDADSIVFLSLSPYGVEGFIETMGQTWIVSSGPFDQDLPIGIYNLTTLPAGVINWAAWECSTDQLDQPVQPIDGVSITTSRGGQCYLLDYAIETDQEYLGLFGGDQDAANTYMATLFGAVSEIYTRDVFTTIQISWSRLWTTTDPWTQGGSVDQLFEYRDYWEANMGSVERDLGHFLSGRGLGGGVAWLPGVCNPGFGYGLSANLNGFFPYPIEDNSSQNWDLMVVSHESGHNVGAPHTHDVGIDNCAGGDCSVTPNGTIMSYCHLCPGGLANVLMQFHPVIIGSHILPTLEGVACDLSCTSLSFSFPGGLPSLVAPDGSTTISMTVAGVGTTNPVAGSGMFNYDFGGGVTSIAMTEGVPNSYSVNVPASACGGSIEYSFSVLGSDGETYMSPRNGVYDAVVGLGFNTLLSMDFESDPGWSVENIDLSDGGWNRGVPVGGGDRGDPSSDFDGSGQCWLTDNVDGNSDVDGGPTRLTSTTMDLSASTDPIFSYARWFTRDDNEGDDSFTVEFSDDNGGSWTLAESTSTGTNAWVESSIRVLDHVSLTSGFRVRFSTWDNPNNSVVEAGVDALRIDELVCGADCAADRNGDGVLDFFDVQNFLNAFAGQEASADLTGDGAWDFFDVQAYLNLFSAGCP
jgi:metallopeptidase family M12-like protein